MIKIRVGRSYYVVDETGLATWAGGDSKWHIMRRARQEGKDVKAALASHDSELASKIHELAKGNTQGS